MKLVLQMNENSISQHIWRRNTRTHTMTHGLRKHVDNHATFLDVEKVFDPGGGGTWVFRGRIRSLSKLEKYP